MFLGYLDDSNKVNLIPIMHYITISFYNYLQHNFKYTYLKVCDDLIYSNLAASDETTLCLYIISISLFVIIKLSSWNHVPYNIFKMVIWIRSNDQE